MIFISELGLIYSEFKGLLLPSIGVFHFDIEEEAFFLFDKAVVVQSL